MTRTHRLSAPPRRLPRAAAAAVATFALAACAVGAPPPASTTLVHSRVIEAAYVPSEVSAAAAAGGLPLVVLGAPPDGSGPEAVAAAMTVPQGLGGQGMALIPRGSDGARVVVAFGAGGGRSSLCDADRAGAVDTGPSLDAMLAWCFDDRAESSLVVASAATQGPGDAGFSTAMNQALRELLPIRNPVVDAGERPRVRPRR